MKVLFDEAVCSKWRRLEIIKDLVPKSRYAAIFSCVDPRYLGEVATFFSKVYAGGFAAVFTEPGGGVPISTLHTEGIDSFLNAMRLIKGLRKLKKLQSFDSMDVWLKFHPDCEWCSANDIGLEQALRHLKKAKYLIDQKPFGQNIVRCAFHIPRGRTYELDVEKALADVEALAQPEAVLQQQVGAVAPQVIT